MFTNLLLDATTKNFLRTIVFILLFLITTVPAYGYKDSVQSSVSTDQACIVYSGIKGVSVPGKYQLVTVEGKKQYGCVANSDFCNTLPGSKLGVSGRYKYLGVDGKMETVCVPDVASTSSVRITDSQKQKSDQSSIKTEIQSLLERIQMLNKKIKEGNSAKINSTAPKNSGEENKNGKKVCEFPEGALSFGSRDNGIGGDVSKLQKSLAEMGHFKGDVTGYFGIQTREAVKSFQKDRGIASYGDELSTGYGRVGGKTRDFLKSQCHPDKEVVAISKASTPNRKFTLQDVESVVSEAINPIAGIADDEYTQYTITLKDSQVIVVKGHAGRGTVQARIKPFREVGYRGDVEELIKKSKPAVLGASITLHQVLIEDTINVLDELVEMY